MCNCEECKRWGRVYEIQVFLRNHGEEALLDGLDELYETYVHDSMDHEHLKAIVDNKWPSAEAYMKEKGWVRG